MLVLIRNDTREILAAGAALTAPDAAYAVIEITDAQAARLSERGLKTLGLNNQISVVLDPAIVAAEQAAQQQAAADAMADAADRATVVQANPIPTLQSYIDTPNASITPGLTYTTVKLLCRVAIWLIRRELKRTI